MRQRQLWKRNKKRTRDGVASATGLSLCLRFARKFARKTHEAAATLVAEMLPTEAAEAVATLAIEL